MKTVKEAAAEYAAGTDKANSERVEKDFIEGVKFAQRWIGIDEELPPENTVVLFIRRRENQKCGCGSRGCPEDFILSLGYRTDGDNTVHFQNMEGDRTGPTHWRPV
jgi:hypothetical protein